MARLRRALRFFLAALLVVLVLSGLGFGGVAWYYSNQINSGAFALEDGSHKLDLVITEVGPQIVTLEGKGAAKDASWQREGFFGLEWPDGYAQVGRITARDATTVTREMSPVRGAALPGQRARIDNDAFDPSPLAQALPFEQYSVATPIGLAPARLIPAGNDTWCIFVHGKGALRRQALRILPMLKEFGCTSLVVTYRNDAGVPKAANHRYEYGKSEWEDLAAAMQLALDRGAREFVLVGYSMGASIILSLLERPHYAAVVSAVILDSPVLDLRKTVRSRARQIGLPVPLIAAAEWLAAKRFGVDWDDIAYLQRISKVSQPLLLIHGEDDKTVPIETSETFAAARSDIVTFRRFPSARHVESWNSDPDGYAFAVRDFLSRFRVEPETPSP